MSTSAASGETYGYSVGSAAAGASEGDYNVVFVQHGAAPVPYGAAVPLSQDSRPVKVQKKCFCFSLILVFVLAVFGAVGILINVYAHTHGVNTFNTVVYGEQKIRATVDYGWNKMDMTVFWDGEQYTQTVTYANATEMMCHVCSNNEGDANYDSDCYCHRMKKAKNSGREVNAIATIAVAYTLTTLFLLLISCTRSCWPKCTNCKRDWFSILLLALDACSCVLYLTSVSLIYSKFIPSLEHVNDYLLRAYFPIIDKLMRNDESWGKPKQNISTIFLIINTILSCLTGAVIYFESRKRVVYGRPGQQYRKRRCFCC